MAMIRSDAAPPDPGDFEAAMADPSCALFVDRAPVDGPLPAMVCFGGLSNRNDVAPFEFVRQTGDFGVHLVFVRDLGQCWYQKGLPGTADGVEATATHLVSVLDGLAASRSVFVGNSSGGFAAVLFGVLCGADEVVAFGPQASITWFGRLRIRERRWTRQARAGRRAAVDHAHIDLVRLLRTSSHPDRITVHHGKGDVMDTRAAHLIGKAPGVAVESHPGGHLFVRRLRDADGLMPILNGALYPQL
jgi:hypothetical protein